MSVIENIRFAFLYIEFYSMGRTWVYPESYIPYNIFRYIVKGKAEFCIDGEEIVVEENQIAYIPQACKMSCRVLSESFEFYSIRFTTSVFWRKSQTFSKTLSPSSNICPLSSATGIKIPGDNKPPSLFLIRTSASADVKPFSRLE